MDTPLLRNSECRLVSLCPTYENVHALLAEIYLYVFSGDGRLLDCQAIRRDKVLVAIAEGELPNAKVVIGPPLEVPAGDLPTLETARRQAAFEADLQYDATQSSYVLPPVPETVWRWWLVHGLWKGLYKKAGKKTGLFW